jgi:Glycosyl transferase family 11
MIFVYLQGGLGNQMFQYAFAKALATEKNMPFVIDTSHFEKAVLLGETPRSIQLQLFQTEFKIASAFDTQLIHDIRYPSLLKRVWFKITQRYPLEIVNDDKSLDAVKASSADHYFLSGYFQNEIYFQDNQDEIRRDFQSKESISIPFETHAKTVSVHIRRGDYITNANASAHHGVCGMDYYERAFSYIESKISNPQYIFFSDDITWCKEHFKNKINAYFIEDRADKQEHEDLVLMSNCAHHIIANSSYSWWGAWLNASHTKIVVAPARWNNAQTSATNQYVPSTWKQL